MRTNERWIAGVAGGVAHRFDLDPTLVRCVWVVLSLFAGVGLVLYGLAWALLPRSPMGASTWRRPSPAVSTRAWRAPSG